MKKHIVSIEKDLKYRDNGWNDVPETPGIYFIIEYDPCPQRGIWEYDAHLRFAGYSDNMNADISHQRCANPDFRAYESPRHIVCYSQQPHMSREELEQCAYALIYYFKPRDNKEGKQAYEHPPVHIQYKCNMGQIGMGSIKKINCGSADIILPKADSTESV